MWTGERTFSSFVNNYEPTSLGRRSFDTRTRWCKLRLIWPTISDRTPSCLISRQQLLSCLTLQENVNVGQWVSALLQKQPLTSRCYLRVFLKRKNCLCSRTGSSGMLLEFQALLCANGWLELMLTLDRMNVTPLPSWSRSSMPKSSYSLPRCPLTHHRRLKGQ